MPLRSTLSACLSGLAWLLSGNVTAADDSTRNALILYGSAGIATWNQSYNNALREHLGADLSQYFTPEYLNLVGATSDERELIARSLALRYSDTDIDLVVAVLPEANTFVHDWGHIFAADAATVHVLPGEDVIADSGHQAAEAYVVSAVEESVVGTVALLPRLLPRLQHLYVVSGVSASDLSYMTRYQSTLESLAPDYVLTYLSGLPPDELVATLREAPPDSAVMMATYDLDSNGREWRTLVVNQDLAAQLDMPVFGITDTLLPFGSFGGYVTPVDSYGAASAAIIRDMVDGVFPAQPVSAQPAYLFNGAQLDRFGINRRLLPPGSLIVNDPANLWRDYDQWIIAGVVIFALQMLLIALLLEAIRRRRVAEAELQRTQKLDALGSLAGGIAHDFNNTLMSIVANTELAMEDHSEDTALKKQLGNVLAASQRARNMVRQILLFSRQSATQSVALLDTSAQLQESVAQIRSSLPLNCRIDLNCASGLAPVYFDSTQLHQVLLNLCVNAEHAMGGAGVIAIQAQNETVNWSRHLFNQKLPPGEYVTISVSDSGSGISAEDLRRVFEPFFSTKAAGKGSGLGLALVYQIMKAHKGFIDLNSQPEHGTRVTLYLKGAADPEAASEPPLRTSRKSRGDNEPILLVDDDIMVLDTTRHILENLGYEVHAFSNSVEALRRFQKDPDYFRLIFSDLSMPEMDGVRLITRARQTRPTIPVILCTGYQESVGANELENCRILLKPVGAVEIAEAVAGALNEAAGPAS